MNESRAGDEVACQEIVALVTSYLEGALEAHQAAEVEAHLALCEGCETYLQQMRQTIALTGTLSVQSLSPQTRAALLAAFAARQRPG